MNRQSSFSARVAESVAALCAEITTISVIPWYNRFVDPAPGTLASDIALHLAT
jgi:hypothetical protein